MQGELMNNLVFRAHYHQLTYVGEINLLHTIHHCAHCTHK